MRKQKCASNASVALILLGRLQLTSAPAAKPRSPWMRSFLEASLDQTLSALTAQRAAVTRRLAQNAASSSLWTTLAIISANIYLECAGPAPSLADLLPKYIHFPWALSPTLANIAGHHASSEKLEASAVHKESTPLTSRSTTSSQAMPFCSCTDAPGL